MACLWRPGRRRAGPGRWLAGLGLPLAAALLLACHDARRENPLDPELTPPVALAVAVDGEAGAGILTWSAYAGEAAFREYRVRRQVQGLTRVETLAVITDPAATGFTDSTMAANTPYIYEVVVVNGAGLESPSPPVVTPGFGAGPVRLLWARGNPRSGAVEVGWSRYREAAFEAYEVWRRTGESRNDTLVAVLTSVEDTTFADPTARADPALLHVYRVVLRAAQEVYGSSEMEARLELPAVAGLAVRLDSRTATAALSWRAYEGPRFASYRVWRRTAVLAPEVVATLASIGDAAYTDSGLVGSVDYRYRVEVVTPAGETAASPEEGGAIHGLLSRWQVPLETDASVRLYGEEEGVTALVASPTLVAVSRYDPDGRLEVRGELLHAPVVPRAVAWARRSDGSQLLAYAIDGRADSAIYITHFDAAGTPQLDRRHDLVLEAGDGFGPSATVTLTGQSATLDRVVVSSAGTAVLEEDFDGDLSRWEFVSSGVRVEEGAVPIGGYGYLRTGHEDWVGLRADIDLALGVGGFLQLRLGATASSATGQMLATVSTSGLQLSLNARSRDGQPLSRLATVAVRQVPNSPIRLTLWSDPETGQARASMQHAVPWSLPLAAPPRAAALALVEGRPGAQVTVVTAGDQAFALSDTVLGLGTQPRQIDELRTWRTADGRQWIGLCQAQANQVLLARASVTVTGRVSLPGVFSHTRLSQAVGQGDGELLLPLSLAGAADGRVYVLDAGNSRIQVFELDGSYLTQWGQRGDGDGEFDLGRGLEAQDFHGSVAVDGQGHIYVADATGRIQRFAP